MSLGVGTIIIRSVTLKYLNHLTAGGTCSPYLLCFVADIYTPRMLTVKDVISTLVYTIIIHS